MQEIKIWEPKWSTNEVLIASYHLKQLAPWTKVKIVFSRWKGGPLYMDAGAIPGYPLTTNGKVACYRVPIKDFETEESKFQERLF